MRNIPIYMFVYLVMTVPNIVILLLFRYFRGREIWLFGITSLFITSIFQFFLFFVLHGKPDGYGLFLIWSVYPLVLGTIIYIPVMTVFTVLQKRLDEQSPESDLAKSGK